DSFSVHYRPVQNISYIADYFFWNSDTTGFHLTNILLHTVSGILLYFLLRQLLPSLFMKRRSFSSCEINRKQVEDLRHTSEVAFLIALIWVVHPVHSAAVDYISGRADSLACFFACGSWLLYLHARNVIRPALRALFYSSAALSALLALASRESGCTWLLVFLLHLFIL